MSVMEQTNYCPDCKTSDFMWYTYSTRSWQCDACWDDWTEQTVGVRQYQTEREVS